ncbi:helix-turn-helix domain-containing protein [Clostridium sp. 19966]|uniref:Crp/Fnr family transcriptional regulator n=1 Tax=Clostridium sp. 19966 TaxID=2768166 RepID=UPI0028DD7C0F|nr:helix-turn-helix domain-containing protein [Clostridium sp. 19966]MDT8717501.1 helix-turn-helix domain-containing protein [Clostridium sp. 19966]
MRRIANKELLQEYIDKFNLEDIFDKALLERAELHFYEKEETILKAEAKLENYYLLVDGKIKVSYLFENGKSMLLKFYKDFNTIGDLELLKDLPIRCDIDAVDDTYLIALSSEIIRREYLNDSRFLRHLVETLSDKLYATINNSSYNFVYPLINRLSSYLVEHLTEENHINLKASFLEIAQFLGTTYRHLNRTLKELEARGLIRCDNKTIYILKEAELKKLAKNIYLKPL